MKYLIITLFIFSLLVAGCDPKTEQAGEEVIQETEGTEMLKEKIAKFAPTELNYDASNLDERQKIVVEKLYHAAKIMDELFLEQVYSKNNEIKTELMVQDSEEAGYQLELFKIMFGPFDRLEHDAPFYGTEKKPLGANYYPEDMTKEEFEKWIADHPDDEKAFTSEFTVIRRDGENLVAIPYNEFYKDKLDEAAKLLIDASEYADNPTLKNYLTTRAVAFQSNDYFESDMAWMDLKDHDIEIVIGPYEVYEDGLFNFKAAFECFLTLRDREESRKLDVFKSYLRDMEIHLPIPDEHKNFERGSESPLAVVNEIFTAGDTKAGVQTLAFNLPNDERVRKVKGSKKVMLKNVSEAKFNKLLKPIAEIIIVPEQLEHVTFNSFFTHSLMHEMSHGIGPGYITVDGRETEVKKELKETYSTLEECKADILGMYNNIFMIEKGEFPESFENEIWVTALAGVFRSTRFGINEAHGGGEAIIYNFLIEKGGFEFNEETEKVKVNFEKVGPALEELATKVLMIQAKGDYQAAKDLIAKYVVLSPSLKLLQEKLNVLPVDIRPIYEIEEMYK
ncbi:MAG: peptidase [Candidatus Cloacimonadota bacterium]|nr:MAG: peptidase [Candidatus Cloacimonadota bacterium]